MMSGYFRTTILLAGLTALFGWAGYMLGGENGMKIALLLAGGMNVYAWFNSDKAVLRHYNAAPISRNQAPEFYGMIETLAQKANLPMPKVYIIDNPQPNAFATGRNPENAAVAATTGLLQRLNADEIEGVMAHELAHIKNRDSLTMTITATLAGGLSMLANFGMMFGHMGGNNENRPSPAVAMLVMILAPLAAMVVQFAISRTREFEADRIGAAICGKPQALASALANIAGSAAQIENRAAEANPATAHMFIINPLHGFGFDKLFSTHPKTEERIKRLMAMQGGVVQRDKNPWN